MTFNSEFWGKKSQDDIFPPVALILFRVVELLLEVKMTTAHILTALTDDVAAKTRTKMPF